jgi:hypothetical protein
LFEQAGKIMVPISKLVRAKLTEIELDLFRREVLSKAERGILNPASANARIDELGLPTLVGEGLSPDQVKDSRLWSLVHALTWIMWRSPRAVALSSNIYRNKYLAWTIFSSSTKPQRLLVPHPLVARYPRAQRWTLRGLRGLEIVDLAKPELTSFVGVPVAAFEVAKSDLVEKLRSGEIIGSGRTLFRGRFDILPQLWNSTELDSEIIRGSGRLDSISKILLDRDRVKALWPAGAAEAESHEVKAPSYGPKVTEALNAFKVLFPGNEHLSRAVTKKSVEALVASYIGKQGRAKEMGQAPSRMSIYRALEIAREEHAHNAQGTLSGDLVRKTS